jgi:Ca-activated chloride channel homolog
MKKIVLFLMIASTFANSPFAQSGRSTRPRIVETNSQPAAIPATDTTSDTATNTSPKNPPVLIGDSSSNSKTPKKAPVLIGVKDNTETSGTVVTPTEAEATTDDDVITVETNLITLPVSVLDRDGRFISGLKQSDFQIFEDGQAQQIEYFASIEQPFTVVLLIDVSNSTSFKINEIQTAAIAFTTQLRREDKLMVVSFDDHIRVLCEPTSDRSIMREAILKTKFAGGTSLYDAVEYAGERLQKMSGRKAIVLFTDGVDTTSKRTNSSQTIRDAEESEALVYPIRYDTSADMNSGNRGGSSNSGGGLLGKILAGILSGGNVSVGSGGGTGTSPADYRKGQQYLDDLARVSGGRGFLASSYSNLESSFSGIAEELRRQYSIGYYPSSEGVNGQRKQVKVRVNQTGYVVRTKNSYIVGESEKKTK